MFPCSESNSSSPSSNTPKHTPQFLLNNFSLSFTRVIIVIRFLFRVLNDCKTKHIAYFVLYLILHYCKFSTVPNFDSLFCIHHEVKTYNANQQLLHFHHCYFLSISTMDSFEVSENAVLESIISLSLTTTDHQFSTWHMFKKQYDNDLKNVAIQIAFKLKDGIRSAMDEDLHNLISKLPVFSFTQKIYHHPALFYICNNYHRDIFFHFIFRYKELLPDFHQCSMVLIDEAYEKTDTHCIPRYLFDLSCDTHGVDFTANLCYTSTIDPSVLSAILEETYIPPKYKSSFKYLLSHKIRRIIEKVDKESKLDYMDIDN